MVDFDAWRTYGLALDTASGALFILLGVFVALVRPRRRVNAAFAVFAISLGLLFFSYNLLGFLSREAPDAWVVRLPFPMAVAFFVASASLVYLGLRFPAPLSAEARSQLAAPTLLVGALIAAHTASYLASGESWRVVLPFVAFGFFFYATFFFLYVLARRYPRAPDARQRSQGSLVAAALTLYAGFYSGLMVAVLSLASEAWEFVASGLPAVACLALFGFWMVATARSPPEARRRARNQALLPLVLMLSGSMFFVTTDADYAFDLGPLGLMRTLGVSILAYAIVRYQLFEIELKVKWTLKQGTVAAIFVAVFFAVSELAQELFAGAVGPVLGILAAGLLVFAIAPLQRAADRVASFAMPGVADTGEYRTVRKRHVYQAALESALQDGTITERERDVLATLADELGLTAGEARALERDLRQLPSPAANR